MDGLTRRELLERGGRAALGLTALPFITDALAAPPTGIYRELARMLQGDVVVPSDSAYTRARVLYNTRFDGIHPRAVAFCESRQDVERTVRWARKHLSLIHI